MIYQTAPLLMTLSNLQSHFSYMVVSTAHGLAESEASIQLGD